MARRIRVRASRRARAHTRVIKARVIKAVKTQTGKSNKLRDRLLKALRPGVRRTPSGRIYIETRANRSDINPRKFL